jgi:hypothetical protein
MGFIIEINEESATGCTREGKNLCNSEFEADLLDCVKSGDCEPACAFVRDCIQPEFRITTKDSSGNYYNRIATDSELQSCACSIFFESEADFEDPDTAKLYLIWETASTLEYEKES